MPQVIQVITYIVPARYFVTILKGIFLKGVGLEVLWGELVFLALYAADRVSAGDAQTEPEAGVNHVGTNSASFCGRSSSRRCASRACACCCSCRR